MTALYVQTLGVVRKQTRCGCCAKVKVSRRLQSISVLMRKQLGELCRKSRLEKTSLETFTWLDFDTAIEELAAKIKSSGLKFDGIYGIPRGGLVVAVALSHRLELPLTFDTEGSLVLVVDDICDSGKTLAPYMQEFVTAVIHIVKSVSAYPSFWVRVRGADWVKYPWERSVNGQTKS